MKNKKILVIILAAAVILLSGLLFAKSLVGDEKIDAKEEENARFKLALSDIISETFPVRNVSVSVSNDGEIAFEGTFLPQELSKISGANIPDSVKPILKLLPEQTEAHGVLRISYDEQGKSVLIDVVRLSLNGYELPQGMLSQVRLKPQAESLYKYLVRE